MCCVRYFSRHASPYGTGDRFVWSGSLGSMRNSSSELSQPFFNDRGGWLLGVQVPTLFCRYALISSCFGPLSQLQAQFFVSLRPFLGQRQNVVSPRVLLHGRSRLSSGAHLVACRFTVQQILNCVATVLIACILPSNSPRSNCFDLGGMISCTSSVWSLPAEEHCVARMLNITAAPKLSGSKNLLSDAAPASHATSCPDRIVSGGPTCWFGGHVFLSPTCVVHVVAAHVFSHHFLRHFG